MSKLLKSRNQYSQFNGVSSYISYADADIFSFTDGINDLPFVIEFDLKRISIISGGNNRIIFKGASTVEWLIDFNVNTNTLRFFCLNSNAASYILASYTTTLNTLYHLKFTYDGSKTANGLKIYNNNVLLATTNSMTGTYTGMTNTTNGLFISYPSAGYYFNGYLRNLKITKNNTLVFQASLQDTNNISKDIIGGLTASTITDMSVVDINETNWSYFNGVDARASLGTTSTFAWIHTGIFRISFTMKLNSFDYLNNNGLIGTGFDNNHTGFAFRLVTTNPRVYFTMSDTTNNILSIGPPSNQVVSSVYKYLCYGDGSICRYIIYNEDDSIFYDSGDVSPSGGYVSQAVTTYPLRFSGGGTPLFLDGYVRDFKIFSDTAGAIPFLSLPMQNAQDIMIDRVGGLIGTATNVQIINTNTNVLKSKNTWCKFGSVAEGALGRVSPIGDATSFNWIHQTGIFRIELECIVEQLISVNDILFTTRIAAAANGMYLFKSTTSGRLYCYFGSGGVNIYPAVNYWTLFTTIGTYKIILIGDGTGVTLWAGLNGATPTSYGKITWTGVIVASGNAALAGTIGGYTTVSLMRGKIRNVKFYNTQDTSGLVYNFPLQDGGNIGKDIVGGLNGTVTGTLTVVDINENGNWAYFKPNATPALNAQFTIGDTSTLGWMNGGVFNMQFDLTHIRYVSSTQRLFYTGNATTNFGFMLIQNSTSMQVYWCNGSGTYAYNANGGTIGFNVPYHYTIQGDGTNIRVIRTVISTGVVGYDSGLVACAYIPNAVTSSALLRSGSYQVEFSLRNFIIYTDYAGTIPFMSLPLQNAQDLMTDRITGLQGTVNNVSIINNNTNVLRHKDLWCDLSNTVASWLYNIGSVSDFNYIHQTGVFRIEWEMILNSSYDYSLGRRIFANQNGGVSYGIRISQANALITVTLNTGGASNYLAISSVANPLDDLPHSYILYGTGTAIYLLRDGVEIGNDTTPVGSLSVANATYAMNFGHANQTAGYSFAGQIRNIKFYTTADGVGSLRNHYPLQDGGRICGDIVGEVNGLSALARVIEI